ncbi:MAG: DUF2203 domain-containing protein [Phycisphaerae bacterium]
MEHRETITAADDSSGPPRRCFTVDQANRALVLVRRIVRDVVDRYAELMVLRSEREDVGQHAGARERVEELDRAIEERVDTLNRLQAELSEIGCDLKDYANGLIDFPAEHAGRVVYLCWRLGEASVTHWHELDAGFSGRRTIGPEFAASN